MLTCDVPMLMNVVSRVLRCKCLVLMSRVTDLQCSDVQCRAKYPLDEIQGDIEITLGICIPMSSQ